MTKKIKKLLVAGLFVASATYASSNDNEYYSKSLVGFEGGYSTFEVKDPSPSNETTDQDFAHAGMKIGAETRNVRLFLSLRNGFISDYDTSYMYGAELQYMFNIASFMNFYIGANVGKINIEFDDSSNRSREFSTQYIGGDAGFNFHLGESVDLEIGARYMGLDDTEHTIGNDTYNFDDITTGYMSLIFKYQMD